ncbi:hypothetical protein EGI26_10795 [Lacihabitans sp. CCS-44]|nr:hypothetical protein [Lacihabitans sp. CCS-44]
MYFWTQNSTTKEYNIYTSETETIKVYIDTVCKDVSPTSKMNYSIYLGNKIEYADVTVWNHTKRDITFSINNEEYFYGERLITEVSKDEGYVGPVSSFNTKKIIVIPNSSISSKILVPIIYNKKKVTGFSYRINYYTNNSNSKAIIIDGAIKGNKLENIKIENSNLDREK